MGHLKIKIFSNFENESTDSFHFNIKIINMSSQLTAIQKDRLIIFRGNPDIVNK